MKSKVDFAHGAVWMLGAALVVLMGAFLMLFNNQIQSAVDQALKNKAPAAPPQIILQMPDGMSAPVAPAKP